MSTRPNILFMHSHNTGAFIQPYGHSVPTPNMQKLAREGVLFRRAYAAAPTCSPSRAAFLTGMYAHSCGMLGLGHRGFAMKDYALHAAHTFKANGYHTVHSGVEHTAPDINVIGYDEILSHEDTNYPDHPNQQEAAGAVVKFLKSNPKKPFFINLGLSETHRPFHKAEPDAYPDEDPRYCIPPRPLPDTPETRADTADFKASARMMDTKFGAVLQALEETGQDQNTLLFCFADHGLQFPRNMCNLTDHGIGVYCIARGPGGFEGGKEINAMVSLIDLLPTAYELADISIPDHIQGQSLLPLVNGQTDIHHQYIYSEVNYHAAYEPMRSVRTDRYKYIRRYDQRDKMVLPNVDDTPSKAFLLDQDWENLPRDQEMLFDLIFDPDEANNLIDRPDLAEIRKELSANLDTWMQNTGDPLLSTGHIPPPSGVKHNDPDDRSPNETPDIAP